MTTTKRPPVVLAPEVSESADGTLALRIVPDTAHEITPVSARRFARYVEAMPANREGFRLTLHPATEAIEIEGPREVSGEVEAHEIIPGRVLVYGDVFTEGRMQGSLSNGWETTLDELEAFGRAVLAVAAEARARRLFE